jgi:hypothetical protein
MFGTRNRSIMTGAAVLEVGIAGFALGHGALWLLVMVAAVTAADTLWGMLRRGVLGDLAGLEFACMLALLVAVRGDRALTSAVAAACAAWLVRPERQEPVVR